MKRSEMLDRMSKRLSMFIGDKSLVEIYVANLLDEAEESGMLAPFVTDGKEDHQEISSFQYVEEYLCYWEDEDGEET